MFRVCKQVHSEVLALEGSCKWNSPSGLFGAVTNSMTGRVYDGPAGDQTYFEFSIPAPPPRNSANQHASSRDTA